MLTSFESFDSLYTGRDMSVDRTVKLLTDTAEHALYAKPQVTAARRSRRGSRGNG